MLQQFSGLAANVITILTLVGLIISIVKNPFKAVKSFYADQKKIQALSDRLDKLEPGVAEIGKDIIEIKNAMAESALQSIRKNIIDFATDLRNGEKKSESQYEYVLEQCDKYLRAGHNGYVKPNIDFIRKKHGETQGL